MFKSEGCSSSEKQVSTNKFLSKLHRAFLHTFSGYFVVKQNRKRFFLNFWVSTGFLSFHELIIVLVKTLALKLLSVHNFPAKDLGKFSLPLTSSTTTVTPSSSSFDNEILFHFFMSKRLPTDHKTRHQHSVLYLREEGKEKTR